MPGEGEMTAPSTREVRGGGGDDEDEAREEGNSKAGEEAETVEICNAASILSMISGTRPCSCFLIDKEPKRREK